MFRGSFEHSIDDKGRLAIPSHFRRLLAKENEATSVVVTNFDKCLVAYSLEKWEQLEVRLAALPQFDTKVLAFQRYFVAAATECPIDKAGRILLPPGLRKFADLERDCFIVGNLTKFEIWSKTRWIETIATLTDNVGTLATSMGDLGIHL